MKNDFENVVLSANTGFHLGMYSNKKLVNLGASKAKHENFALVPYLLYFLIYGCQRPLIFKMKVAEFISFFISEFVDMFGTASYAITDII